MAWLERRGKRFRVVFRFQDQRFLAVLKATDAKEAEACRGRVEENLRLVERGRLTVPDGADLGLFLLSDGKREQPARRSRQRPDVAAAGLAKPVRIDVLAGVGSSRPRPDVP